MTISSVASSTTAGTQAVRPPAQADKADQTRQAADEKAKAQAKQQAEAAKPVVNTQGQTTGTIVNTIA